jgi:hypothetical protein
MVSMNTQLPHAAPRPTDAARTQRGCMPTHAFAAADASQNESIE